CDEVAETEPPAGQERLEDAPQKPFAGRAGRTVQQPYQYRKRDQACGEEIEGWLAKGRDGAGQKSSQRPAPPPQQYDPAGQALHHIPKIYVNHPEGCSRAFPWKGKPSEAGNRPWRRRRSR